VLSYTNKLDALKVSITGMRENIDIFIDEQIAGIGIPKPVVMCVGVGSNRATLEQLTEIGARNIESIHRSIEEGLNGMVYEQMLDKRQIKAPVTIKFKPLKVEEKFVKMDTLIGLVQAGIISPEDDLEVWVRDYLEFPKRVGEFNPKESNNPFGEQVGANIVDDIKRSKTY
jgi:hypothetical protein